MSFLYYKKEETMVIEIISRKGEKKKFTAEKIMLAIYKANKALVETAQVKDKVLLAKALAIAAQIEDDLIEEAGYREEPIFSVEEVEQKVVRLLFDDRSLNSVAVSYQNYMLRQAFERAEAKDVELSLTITERENEEVKEENSNKNPTVASVQRDYLAGEQSKKITKHILPKEVWEAHQKGLIHFHDSDYFAQHIHNCCLINLEDMLQNGTVISETMIEKPHSFATACNVATQIIAQVASNQYGGQTVTLAHLVPFVEISRKKHRKEVKAELKEAGIEATTSKINSIAEKRLIREVKAGIQTIQYQVITLMTTNGQAPFITVSMYLNEVPEGQSKKDLALMIEVMLEQRILGVKNEKGVYITPAFPKLIYVLEEDNVTPNSKYWYLTELAAKCTAKRMVPDYVSEKVMKQLKHDKTFDVTGEGAVYPPMGCRSFLTPDRTKENVSKALNYKEGEAKYYGRFNQGVVTLNLVDVALSSGKDITNFWNILDERLELCHTALRYRHERLLGTPSDVSPIHWQHGALARLEKGETIDKLLYGGYSTISLGYAGLYEMTFYMTGLSHTDPKAQSFAMQVMQRLNDACAKWKVAENIDYSVYGTPLESTTYKFATCLQKRFGKIPGVTDKNYITNSYHVHVTEEINAFDKLSFEAPFQALSPGGAISYVEVPNMNNNIEAILALMRFMYDNIMYAEINSKSDYCQVCGFDGEIQIVNDKKHPEKLVWECPCCGNRDENKLNVARRTCGYIGTQFWNQGRTQEIKDRVLHIGYRS